MKRKIPTFRSASSFHSSLKVIIAFATGLSIGFYFFEVPSTPVIQSTDHMSVQACFTPARSCTPLIINAINNAQKRVYVQAYSFTSAPIAQALKQAYRRGVDVQVIVDKSQLKQKHSQAKILAEAQVPLYVDNKVAIAHNKVILIDETTVITGSFNFTNAAEKRNAENFVMIENQDLNLQFLQNWLSRHSVSELYSTYLPLSLHSFKKTFSFKFLLA
jgi:phosphatidylserine/phosphatidylglycerophosphate/cardiolipin synthase-like enzyme